MTPTFLLLAAVMVIAALAFVLWPLWRRDSTAPQRRRLHALQQAHPAGVIDAAEYEAKRARLVADADTAPAARPWPAIALLLLALPLGALLLYRHVGEPAGLDPQARIAAPAAPAADGAPPPDMEQAVAGLAERLRNEPDNLEGWLLLGRAYKSMERFEPARTALANAYRLAPADPDVMVEYAEAQALASAGRRFDGESLALLEAAVRVSPEHQRGIWLQGIAAMQAGDPARAIGHWQRLQALLPDDAEAQASLQTQIDAARAQLGEAVPATAAAAPAATPLPPAAPASAAVAESAPAADGAAAGAARLTVQVELDPALRARVGASDVLFVYARAPEGPRMPLAIHRLPAASLPVTVVLDDSTSMMPQLTLSSLPVVVVGARISRSGQAMPQPGDFETQSEPVPVTRSEPVQLRIDRVVE